MPRSKEGYFWTPTQETDGLATDAVQPSTPVTGVKATYDVIVIGAGFAGLIAARDLSQRHKLSVLLVEARDRIGGRTWTAKVLGEEIEMGGTWVHWAQPHLYAELHRYGLHRYLKKSAGTLAPQSQLFTPASGVVEEVHLAETAATLDRVAERVFTIDGRDSRGLMPYPHDPLRAPAPWRRYDHLSVRDRLDQLCDIPQREKDLFESNMNTIGSAPGKDIGFVEALRWFALGGHSIATMFEMAGVYKLGKSGMTSLALAMLRDYTGDRLFDTVVDEISHDALGVKVTTKTGRKLRAKGTICTIPLNCLGDIKFNPSLSPLRTAAIKEGHINKGAKIHFKLRETLPGFFWTSDGYGDSSFVFAFSDHNGTQPTGPAGTWCIGFGYNGKLADKKDARHIVGSFKKDIMPDVGVEAYATHDWMNDPYAKGVWACWGPNGSRYLEELQKPHGRVIFASADWADGWRGFVDGAIERGQVAVQDVTEMLKGHQANSAKL
jgi:lysyl oxidase-like protein 2/3/4